MSNEVKFTDLKTVLKRVLNWQGQNVQCDLLPPKYVSLWRYILMLFSHLHTNWVASFLHVSHSMLCSTFSSLPFMPYSPPILLSLIIFIFDKQYKSQSSLCTLHPVSCHFLCFWFRYSSDSTALKHPLSTNNRKHSWVLIGSSLLQERNTDFSVSFWNIRTSSPSWGKWTFYMMFIKTQFQIW